MFETFIVLFDSTRTSVADGPRSLELSYGVGCQRSSEGSQLTERQASDAVDRGRFYLMVLVLGAGFETLSDPNEIPV